MQAIAELMQKAPIVINSKNTILEVIALMREEVIGSVLIEKSDKIVGIFTERDLLNKININDFSKVGSQKVEELMTQDLITVDQGEIYTKAIDLMEENNIRHMPITNNGSIVGIVSFRDLLAYNNKMLTEQMIEREKAERDLKEAYDELRNTQRQLIESEKMRTVGALAAGVAHEVKNPLMAILQSTEYIMKVIPNDNKDLQLALDNIVHAVHSANEVVIGLLDFSRLSKLEAEMEDINSILHSTIVLLKHQIEKQKIRLEEQLAADLPQIKLDKNKMGQVFINVIMNSLQAVHDGGEIGIRTQLKKVDEYDLGVGRRENDPFRTGDQTIHIEISNSGPPIPEDFINKIFDPFVTGKRDRGGTGLGLAIVQNIVELHNGIIFMKNGKEKGVVTTIILKV